VTFWIISKAEALNIHSTRLLLKDGQVLQAYCVFANDGAFDQAELPVFLVSGIGSVIMYTSVARHLLFRRRRYFLGDKGRYHYGKDEKAQGKHENTQGWGKNTDVYRASPRACGLGERVGLNQVVLAIAAGCAQPAGSDPIT